MAAHAFALFHTAFGSCGIAWSARGVTGVQLPQDDEAAARRRLRRRFPGATEATPPPDVQAAIRGIAALLDGEASDLSAVALDTGGISEFDRRVYAAARQVPPGATITYGEIARLLDEPEVSRDVGQAMARNRFPIVVPCHRVVAAGGKLGGFSAHGGIATKRRLLAVEGRHSQLFATAPSA